MYYNGASNGHSLPSEPQEPRKEPGEITISLALPICIYIYIYI